MIADAHNATIATLTAALEEARGALEVLENELSHRPTEDSAAGEIYRLEAENAKLRNALGPFVKPIADRLASIDLDQESIHGFEDGDLIDQDLHDVFALTTYGDLRRARTALPSPPKDPVHD